jgi:hypothetical protein
MRASGPVARSRQALHRCVDRLFEASILFPFGEPATDDVQEKPDYH